MQQLQTLTSGTPSIKRIFPLFYWVENSFSNKTTPRPPILVEASGYQGHFSEAMSFSKLWGLCGTYEVYVAIMGSMWLLWRVLPVRATYAPYNCQIDPIIVTRNIATPHSIWQKLSYVVLKRRLYLEVRCNGGIDLRCNLLYDCDCNSFVHIGSSSGL